MSKKKALRAAGTDNGAIEVNHILTRQRLKNKVHNAVLHGTVAGAFAAVIAGALAADMHPLFGVVMAALGTAWIGLFYLINPDDFIFRG